MVHANSIKHRHTFFVVDVCCVSYKSVHKTVLFDGNKAIYQNRSIWFSWSDAL